MLSCAKDKFYNALLHELTYLIARLLLFPTLEIPVPECMLWIAASYKQISTDHFICFTSCTQPFTSQCTQRQANSISITFGIVKRLDVGSICAWWMRHKWDTSESPQSKSLWYSVSKASPPQNSLKPLKCLLFFLCRRHTSRKINESTN